MSTGEVLGRHCAFAVAAARRAHHLPRRVTWIVAYSDDGGGVVFGRHGWYLMLCVVQTYLPVRLLRRRCCTRCWAMALRSLSRDVA